MVFRLNDDALGHTRRLVGLSLVGLTLSDVMETKCTGVLGNDDSVERVPTADDIVFLHHVTILEEQRRAVRHVKCSEDDFRVRINELDLCKTADNHLAIDVLITALINELNCAQSVKLQYCVVFRLDARVGRGILCHTT